MLADPELGLFSAVGHGGRGGEATPQVGGRAAAATANGGGVLEEVFFGTSCGSGGGGIRGSR